MLKHSLKIIWVQMEITSCSKDKAKKVDKPRMNAKFRVMMGEL